MSLDELIAEQKRIGGWRFRWHMLVARIRIKWALWRGWRPTVHTVCFECLHPIVEQDDDACVCIQCGGMNRRLLRV